MDAEDAVTALALSAGLLLVVFVENALKSLGVGPVATVVYPVGYGALVLVGWHVWIRPLDIRAPDPADSVWQSGDAEDPTNETEAE